MRHTARPRSTIQRREDNPYIGTPMYADVSFDEMQAGVSDLYSESDSDET